MDKHLRILFVALLTLLLSGCAGGSFMVAHPNEEAAAKTPVEPHKITLLLPLNGEVGSSGQAVKNGFLAAYYYYHEQKPGLNVNVINTSGLDVVQLYAQAVAAGSDVIVGPLTKQEVEKVGNMGQLVVPTIALNTLDYYQSHAVTNLYQFGLLPQDEAYQVASKMLATGAKQVAIIAPEGALGEKIIRSFREKFEGDGGRVVTMLQYGPKDDLTSGVCNLVAQDPSQMCIKRKERNKLEELPLEKVRRQDIDAIFLVASPRQGRQIIPLLKFYYAGDLPVFATSMIYKGTPQPALDQDLNGVVFCDIPWVFQESGALTAEQDAIRKQIIASWPDGFANTPELYGLGVDAFDLAMNFHNFLLAPQGGEHGVTGILYLDKYNHIFRQLDWAQMQQGVPVRQ
jgi:uncharacterized protein